MRQIRTLQNVVDWGLCTGCGACYSACSRRGVTLVNVEGVGIRPRFSSEHCAQCTECLSICPGYAVDAELATGPRSKRTEFDHEFGPALEIWEGHAADSEIRFRASSGGILSALALYCLEQEGMEFVLHTGMDEQHPWRNRTVQSRNRSEVLARAGSRYAPASPCDGLRSVEESVGPAVFIGKPCDTAAVIMMRQQKPQLDQKLGLVLAFFCAGTPSSRGTVDLIRSLQVKPENVQSLRFRGEGWPGRFKVLANGGVEQSLTYSESWGALTSYRPMRCHLCPDGLGRVADISCGDAWDKFEENDDPGRSLILVRTERGREILRKAMAAGYVVAVPTSAGQVLEAQSNLLARRREIFGRLVGMQMMGVPVPQFKGFSLCWSWIRLPFKRKLWTIAGTVVRLIRRGRWRRQPIVQ